LELTDPHITKLSSRAATPPVELWRPFLNASLPTLLDHAPVIWRHRTQQSIWRLAVASLRGFRRVLDDQGFTEIYTPKLIASSPSPAPASRSWVLLTSVVRSTQADDAPAEALPGGHPPTPVTHRNRTNDDVTAHR